MGEQTLERAQIHSADQECFLEEAETEQKGGALPFLSLKSPVRMLYRDVFTGVRRKG